MARTNKFANMVKVAREYGDDDEVRGRGRPAVGKRSNPDYESTTIYLRKNTKRKMAVILLDRDDDLSDIVEMLLSKWASENS